MKKSAFILCLLPLAAALADGDKRIHLFTAIDLGRVENGYDLRKTYDPSGDAMNRTYVDVGFVQQLDENYMLSVGVGGIFWKAYETGGGNPEDKVIKFGPGISNAYMKWAPSDKVDLTFGYFPYKYNQAARNLGEYLFRTEAYPTIIYTGGWSWMNDVQYRTVGAKLTLNMWDGRFKHDIGFFGEYFNAPIYDITPAYIATLKAADWLTVGGATSLHRFISPTPQTKKELTKSHAYRENFFLPEVKSKSRFKVTIPDYIGTNSFDIVYSTAAPNLDSLRNAIFVADSSTLAAYSVLSAAAIPLAEDTTAKRKGRAGKYATKLESDLIQQARDEGSDSATYFGDSTNITNVPKSVSFDLAAVKVLAFFELDFNKLLGWDEAAMGKFNLYGEVAQLGLKNYPIFYTEYAQRRPMMLGFSLPTWGLLGNLTFEMEYLKNSNVESIASTYDKLDLSPDEEFRYQAFAEDDLKWTVHASKPFSKFLTLYLQVANDHMRLKNGFGQPQYVPVTNEPSHWYWLTRIQWMI